MAVLAWRFSILLSLLLAPLAIAAQFKVGGPPGWTVPANPNTYNEWAQKMRFRIGDSLLFVYPSDKDSVLQVSKEDYDSCNTKSPITRFNDGNTVFSLSTSGPFYFISGVEDNCVKNEKMIVVVMADRSGNSNQPPAGSSTPSSPASNQQGQSTPPPPSNAARRDAASGVISAGVFLGASALFLA